MTAELCENGDIRLSGGQTLLSGQVEVCINRTWETICIDMWDDVDASIACKQLGNSAYGRFGLLLYPTLS